MRKLFIGLFASSLILTCFGWAIRWTTIEESDDIPIERLKKIASLSISPEDAMKLEMSSEHESVKYQLKVTDVNNYVNNSATVLKRYRKKYTSLGLVPYRICANVSYEKKGRFRETTHGYVNTVIIDKDNKVVVRDKKKPRAMLHGPKGGCFGGIKKGEYLVIIWYENKKMPDIKLGVRFNFTADDKILLDD